MADSGQPEAVWGVGDASYQAAGQFDGIRALVDAFYDAMETLPEAKKIREMHPVDLSESRDKLTRFLCGWLGGPRLYREKYGPIAIPRAHAHLDIQEAERDPCPVFMDEAQKQLPYEEGFKKYLMTQLFVPAERCRLASQAVRQ